MRQNKWDFNLLKVLNNQQLLKLKEYKKIMNCFKYLVLHLIEKECLR